VKPVPKKLVDAGGVAAGTSAASMTRRIDPQMEIIFFEKGPYVSYGTIPCRFLLS